MVSRDVEKQQNMRLSIVKYLFFIILGILSIRLFSIQVVKHGHYKALAEDQYWNLSVIPAQRGNIISSDNYIFAGTQTHYLLYGEPKKVTSIVETAHLLAEVFTEIDEKAIPVDKLEEFNRENLFKRYYDHIHKNLSRDLYWVVIKNGISPVDKKIIEEMNIAGIGFEEEPVRYYPENSMAAHVLGFVAFNEKGEKQGYFGIEGALNSDLKGKAGRIFEEQDALGNPILLGGYKKASPVKGRDIVLSINRTVQYLVEKKLQEGVERYNAKSGSIIVMNPHTGEIIAMANYPTYAPDDFNYSESDNDLDVHRKSFERRNKSISEIYEPGSVMKAFTIATGIELGAIKPETTFNDEGPVRYSDYVIDNWDGKHHGVQNIRQLLEKSNNIGAAWVGHFIGSKDFSYFLKEFGFGSKTNIDLEGEDTDNLRDYRQWTDIDLANISFGQGISATPLQVLNGFNVLANGGFLLQPKIISKVIDDDKSIEMPVRHIHRVISKQSSDTMTDLLESAAHGGEAKFFILKNYRIAGKTGTAQIFVDGKYDQKRTNATFVGYMAENKEFSMIVKLEEPTTSTYASETAVPLWMEITSELVKYYGIAPNK